MSQALITLLILLTPLAARSDDKTDFVRTNGAQLQLRGAPFRFIGANLAVMHHPVNRVLAERVIQEAAKDGIRVGRVWAVGEGLEAATTWQRDHFLFRAGQDGWIDAAPDHLDFVLAAAKKAGIRIIITLSNNWADYGGVPRYVEWFGLKSPGDFYTDPRAKAAFRNHLDRLVGRVNHLTGVPYRNDPTILAWELMNESTVAESGFVVRRAWVVEMARAIRAADPDHLVMSGVSTYRTSSEAVDWLAICMLPEVDVCDGHLYPEGQPSASMIDHNLDDFLRNACDIARKPFILGEFGFMKGVARERAAWMKRVFERLDGGAAGGLVWIYQPTTDPNGYGIGVLDRQADDVRDVVSDFALKLKGR